MATAMGLTVVGRTNPGREALETIVNTAFAELGGSGDSYGEAKRGLRQASASRPVVTRPDDIALLDELVMTSGENLAAPRGARTTPTMTIKTAVAGGHGCAIATSRPGNSALELLGLQTG